MGSSYVDKKWRCMNLVTKGIPQSLAIGYSLSLPKKKQNSISCAYNRSDWLLPERLAKLLAQIGSGSMRREKKSLEFRLQAVVSAANKTA
ncbi:MAG: hypothetical protein HY231_27130 [Acidobacteria bacterium]|nr:hypothetical protein [Acidobacteriota bacterium]